MIKKKHTQLKKRIILLHRYKQPCTWYIL